MRNRLLLLCVLLVSIRGVSGAEERLSFDRPSRVGDFLQAEINLTAQRDYRFVFPGPDRPVEKQESLVTTLFADLKILEVNTACEKPYDRHDDVIDKRVDDSCECRAYDKAYCHVHHVSSCDELAEFRKKTCFFHFVSLYY